MNEMYESKKLTQQIQNSCIQKSNKSIDSKIYTWLTNTNFGASLGSKTDYLNNMYYHVRMEIENVTN